MTITSMMWAFSATEWVSIVQAALILEALAWLTVAVVATDYKERE